MDNTAVYIVIALASILIILGLRLIFKFIPVLLWISALGSGVHVSLLKLVRMRRRKIPPAVIINNMISANKAGVKLDCDDLEAHFLAGGRVKEVVNALISAQQANIPLDFKTAAAIDLEGRDVLEAVQMSVKPKVINTPPVAKVVKDGTINMKCSNCGVEIKVNSKFCGFCGEKVTIGQESKARTSTQIGIFKNRKTLFWALGIAALLMILVYYFYKPGVDSKVNVENINTGSREESFFQNSVNFSELPHRFRQLLFTRSQNLCYPVKDGFFYQVKSTSNPALNLYYAWYVGCPDTRGRGQIVVYDHQITSEVGERFGYEITGPPDIELIKDTQGHYPIFRFNTYHHEVEDLILQSPF